MLDAAMRDYQLSRADKSFLTELVYGTTRWRGKLDWVIAQFVHRQKLRKIQKSKSWGGISIVSILRLGLYQILFLDSVPDHAAVNESVKLAKKYGMGGISGLVNAVLRNAVRQKGRIPFPDIRTQPVKHIAAKYSHPEWMVKRWIKRFGIEETIKLCSANNDRPSLYIRTNTLKVTRDQLMRSLKEEGVNVVESTFLPESIRVLDLPLSISELSSYKQGWFQVQDEGSMVIAHILNPQQNEIIIDTCAAPGGKTTHIAELMENRGKILAVDIDSHRLPLIDEAAERLGISIIETTQADARDIDDHLPEGGADRVLIDVPCTGLGVLRHRVESRWRRTLNDVVSFPKLQYELLCRASHYVKPGGILLYSTCTIEPEENQLVVQRFLRNHPEFAIERPHIPQLKAFQDMITEEGYVQTYPHRHNMDGFFAARIVRCE